MKGKNIFKVSGWMPCPDVATAGIQVFVQAADKKGARIKAREAWNEVIVRQMSADHSVLFDYKGFYVFPQESPSNGLHDYDHYQAQFDCVEAADEREVSMNVSDGVRVLGAEEVEDFEIEEVSDE